MNGAVKACIRLGAYIFAHGKEILGGISKIGTVGGAIAAGVGTHRTEKDIQESKQRIQEIENSLTQGTITEVEAKKMVRKEFAKAGWKTACHYLPAALCVGGSIIAHTQQEQMYDASVAALVGACAGLKKKYENYSERVKDELGEEKEKALAQALEKGPNGALVSKLTDEELDLDMIFDSEHTTNYVDDMSVAEDFIRMQYTYSMSLSSMSGFVSANEIFREMGVKKEFLTDEGYLWGIKDTNGTEPTNAPEMELTSIPREYVREDGEKDVHNVWLIHFKNLVYLGKKVDKQ